MFPWQRFQYLLHCCQHTRISQEQEGNAILRLQKWLRERAVLLPHAYIAHLIIFSSTLTYLNNLIPFGNSNKHLTYILFPSTLIHVPFRPLLLMYLITCIVKRIMHKL
jgi:hypothetical protein